MDNQHSKRNQERKERTPKNKRKKNHFPSVSSEEDSLPEIFESKTSEKVIDKENICRQKKRPKVHDTEIGIPKFKSARKESEKSKNVEKNPKENWEESMPKGKLPKSLKFNL